MSGTVYKKSGLRCHGCKMSGFRCHVHCTVQYIKCLDPSVMGFKCLGSWGCLVSQTPGSHPLQRGGWKTNTHPRDRIPQDRTELQRYKFRFFQFRGKH